MIIQWTKWSFLSNCFLPKDFILYRKDIFFSLIKTHRDKSHYPYRFISIFLFNMLQDNSLGCSLFFTGTLTRLTDLKSFVQETDVLVSFHYTSLTPTLWWKMQWVMGELQRCCKQGFHMHIFSSVFWGLQGSGHREEKYV